MTRTAAAIERIVAELRPLFQSDREREWVHDALLQLVKLAQAEQMLRMKRDVGMAIGDGQADDRD